MEHAYTVLQLVCARRDEARLHRVTRVLETAHALQPLAPRHSLRASAVKRRCLLAWKSAPGVPPRRPYVTSFHRQLHSMDDPILLTS